MYKSGTALVITRCAGAMAQQYEKTHAYAIRLRLSHSNSYVSTS